MTEHRAITAEVDRGVLRITLCRPPLNILDANAIDGIAGALESAQAQASLKAVLFSAQGKAFSAGVEVADHLPDRVKATLKGFHRIFRILSRSGLPAVACVEGAALGGGCELAGVCDWVYATPNAKFGLPEITLGVFPPVALAYFPRLIGYRNTADLVLTGRIFPAEEALQMGLVTRVVPAGEIHQAIETVLDNLRAKSAHILRIACRALRETAGRPSAQALDLAEGSYFSDIVPSRDMGEGLAAFIEKRKPVWGDR